MSTNSSSPPASGAAATSGRRVLLPALLLLLATAESSVAAEEAFVAHTLATDPVWQATAGAFVPTEVRLGVFGASPASASNQELPTLAFSHLQWAGGLSREWAAIGTPLGSRLGVSADVGLLRGAALDGFDEAGNSTGTFSPTEWDAGASVGLDLGRGFGLGLGGRYFRLEDPTDALTSFGVSFGLRWSTGTRALAASVSDLGSTSDERYALPTRYRVGAEQWISQWIRVGAAAEQGAETAFSLGAEIRPTQWISLLGGVGQEGGNQGRGFHWSTGLSLERSGVRASYAFLLDGELGDRHQIGFELPLRGTARGWNRSGAAQTP